MTLDLFAGPGGWDLGARAVGLDPLGLELDPSACATREAAGLRTERINVAHVDPADYAPCEGLIASPPCQAWSMAGKREGEHDRAEVYRLARELAAGIKPKAHEWADQRSPLAAEPMRWVKALQPRWCAFEQVPPVLPLWELLAHLMEPMGFRTWTGIISSERFGVPQTRRRAFLLASLDGPVTPPEPTHQAWVHGEPQWPEPCLSLEGELLPWVSMAEALGWGGAVGFPRRADEGAATDDGYRERDFRDADEPAFNLTEKARSWEVRDTGCTRSGEQPDGGRHRNGAEPAPPLTSRADQMERRWYDRRQGQTLSDGSRRMVPLRPDSSPAPTLQASGLARGRDVWTNGRPATTVAGDPRVPAPGHEREVNAPDSPGRMEGAVRVSIEEAAILQGFPADYPWQGSRSAQFQQIGNAVPPPVAAAVLGALIREPTRV